LAAPTSFVPLDNMKKGDQAAQRRREKGGKKGEWGGGFRPMLPYSNNLCARLKKGGTLKKGRFMKRREGGGKKKKKKGGKHCPFLKGWERKETMREGGKGKKKNFKTYLSKPYERERGGSKPRGKKKKKKRKLFPLFSWEKNRNRGGGEGERREKEGIAVHSHLAMRRNHQLKKGVLLKVIEKKPGFRKKKEGERKKRKVRNEATISFSPKRED